MTTVEAARATARGPDRTGRLRASLGRHWYAWAMVTPVVVVLGVLVFYPLARGIVLSFTDAQESNVGRTIGVNHIPATYHFVGLRNYIDALSGADAQFYGRLVWTLIWTAVGVTCHYTIGLGLAVLLNRRVRGRTLYRIALIVPWAVPPFVGAFAWRLMMNSQNGVFNAVLGAFGASPVPWLNDPLMAKVSVIAVNVWMGVPFMMVALLGGLQAIPRELYEAAEMDGASPWQRFANVTLPGLRSVSGTVVLLGIIWTFNQFAVIYLMLGQNASASTEILVTYAYRAAFTGIHQYAVAATYGIIILSMLVVFAVFYRRALERGAAGSVTG